MTKMPPPVFEARPVVILELPLASKTRLLRPEQVMLKVFNRVHDVGAFCYALRSNKMRNQGKAREVVLGSLRKERIDQIRKAIRTFSNFIKEGGKRPATVDLLMERFKSIMDWADTNGHHDCLAGGDATRHAYRSFASHVADRFGRHEIEWVTAFHLQAYPLTVLEALSGLTDLGKGIRFIKKTSGSRGGTEPVATHDFAHALALNDAMYKGLCDFVLEHQPFPFKLTMPGSLGWTDRFLWVFPTLMWCLPPHQWGEARGKLGRASWVYDYEQGRIATEDEIWHRYIGPDSQKRGNAKKSIANAQKTLKAANADKRNHYRRMLAMAAHNAFYFLFLANTSGNQSVVNTIETDGTMDESTTNPGYRNVKWRADGKEVSLIVPVAFVPYLRRYMDLRKYLLNGKEFPYLFLSLGGGKRSDLKPVTNKVLVNQYGFLRRIDPPLPRMGVHKVRATALNYFRQNHGPTLAAWVGQHKEETSNRNYDAGTEADHHEELTSFLQKVVHKAQQVVPEGTLLEGAKPLVEGGGCQSFGNPEAIASDVPMQPDCKKGCLFCAKRVLIAGEEDARKIASAAFLLERLIMGPMSEKEFRPHIVKCDEDLAKIRAFDGCAEVVDRVKKDVFDNGNLTPYFADKYELFLALGDL